MYHMSQACQPLVAGVDKVNNDKISLALPQAGIYVSYESSLLQTLDGREAAKEQKMLGDHCYC